MFQKAVLFVTLLVVTIVGQAQEVPSPTSHFGFNIGDNYQLANYTQTESYLQKLATASKKNEAPKYWYHRRRAYTVHGDRF